MLQTCKKKAIRSLSLLLLSCVIVLAVMLPMTAQAAEALWTNSDTNYSVYIDDQASLLTDNEKQQLESKMEPITEYGNAIFVSVNENSNSTYNYGANYYYNLIGNDSGTLFIVDMDNRQIYLLSSGANYETLTDSKSDTITDNCYQYASDGDYYSCAAEAFDECYTVLSGGKIAEPMRVICAALVALGVAFVVNFIIISRASRLKRARMSALINAANVQFTKSDARARFLNETKTYSPVEHSSGGGGGGGGFSGGGGGGGFSGGGGGHSF